jgi:hypothetical protein
MRTDNNYSFGSCSNFKLMVKIIIQLILVFLIFGFIFILHSSDFFDFLIQDSQTLKESISKMIIISLVIAFQVLGIYNLLTVFKISKNVNMFIDNEKREIHYSQNISNKLNACHKIIKSESIYFIKRNYISIFESGSIDEIFYTENDEIKKIIITSLNVRKVEKYIKTSSKIKVTREKIHGFVFDLSTILKKD